LGVILAPIRKAAPGLTGWAAVKLEQAARAGITFATVGEAQEWLGQQIAGAFYDPQATYSPDAKRLAASLIGGALPGAATPHGTAKPSDPLTEEARAGIRKEIAEGRASPAEVDQAYGTGVADAVHRDAFGVENLHAREADSTQRPGVADLSTLDAR